MFGAFFWGMVAAAVFDSMRPSDAKARLPILGKIPTLIVGPEQGILDQVFGDGGLLDLSGN